VYTDIGNTPTPSELFAWWCGLQTPATAGTTLADWEVVQYRDAWCFSRRGRSDNEAYLIRSSGLTHFGWDHDTLESAYRMLTQNWRPQPVDTRVVQRRLAWVSE
jgi:hypothetical protein